MYQQELYGYQYQFGFDSQDGFIYRFYRIGNSYWSTWFTVSPNTAEAVSGLYYPICLDWLREMIDDSSTEIQINLGSDRVNNLDGV